MQFMLVEGSDNLRGGSRAHLNEGQFVVGALKNCQKLVTNIRCIQPFQTLTSDRRLSIQEILTIVAVYFVVILEVN